jgi:hydroxymethylpyrimidine/phosphomethylpyrimidine kinase
MASKGRVLIIAGSDSGGGAGIQGDIKTVTCLNGYAATAITALTAQNTQGVFGIHDVPPDFISQQIELVIGDIGADAFKIGMLSKKEAIEAIALALTPYSKKIPLVLDTVMFAKGGSPLLELSAIDSLVHHLFPQAAVITPNIPEAEHLAHMQIRSVEDMREAAHKLLARGPHAVLVKGGHLEGDKVIDLLLDTHGETTFESERVHTRHTHGTGCTYASAIATGMAQGMTLIQSVRRAHEYVQLAIRHAPGLGHGHGPLGHNYKVSE